MSKSSNRCVRKNFDKNGGVICQECFKRDLLIDSLREELKIAKTKIRSMEKKRKKKITRKDVEESAHAPSSTRKFRTNSTLENQLKKGGAKFGHKGAGRKSLQKLSRYSRDTCPLNCPDCQTPLAPKDMISRTVVDAKPAQAVRRKIILKRGQCSKCRKTFKGSPPMLSRSLYGNQLLSQTLVMHYVYGISIGRILEVLGPEVTKGGLINSFHYFGKICGPARDILIESIKKEEVRNADETGWRTDGQSGFAWIFRSQKITIFEHCDSRGSKIPKSILGEGQLEGFLVVDWYGGYNQIKVKIQYCYAHLLREIKKLEKDFPEDNEIKRFPKKMGSLMKDAMNLQGKALTTEQYISEANAIKKALIKEINYPYQNLGIRYFQHIFITKKDRLYCWAENPNVPADNNRAEREIRSAVIARKTSFGSQSKRGAKTRSNIMSVLLTVKKRINKASIEQWSYQTLNAIAQNPKLQIIDCFPDN